MRRHTLLTLIIGTLAVLPSMAQVLSPAEIAEPAPQQLQDKYFEQLKAFAADAHQVKFAYPFYFSRTLDLELPQQAGADQRSIAFDLFNRQVVLKMTGNYFASYSTAALGYNQRTVQTFRDVVLPLLKIAAPRFNNIEAFQAYAIEVSHHIRNKVLGTENESFENVVYVFPREAVGRLVKATTPEQQQAAVLDGQIYVDGEPFMMWINGEPPAGKTRPVRQAHRQASLVSGPQPESSSPIEPTVNPKLMGMKEAPMRVMTAEQLGVLNTENQETVGRLARELDQEAHFVPYSPPTFIRFRNGAYLQLAVTTPLNGTMVADSRYKVAALAFDEHIAHLVRPVLAYFPEEPGFDGVDFSTTVKFSNSAAPASVEFIFPIKMLRCYANYDCTGQQLIDAGIVLMNDDRIALNLQVAEK